MKYRQKQHSAIPQWLSLSLVAGGLYLALGQVAQAIPSSNYSQAAHGRQVTLEGTPTITTNGSTISVSQLPTVKDQDNDAHIGWKYVWEVAGSGTEQTTELLTTIPTLTPTAAMEGRSVQLKVKGLAETRSYPLGTATSTVSASNIIQIPYSSTSVPPANTWRGLLEDTGTFTMGGTQVIVSLVAQSNLTTYGFSPGQSCSGYPNITNGTLIGGGQDVSSHKIRFSKPVTNVKVLVGAVDANEEVTITTNAATTLKVFGSFGNSNSCMQPSINGNTIASTPYKSYAYYVSVGGEYYTELTISHNHGGGGSVAWLNYDHVTLQ